MPVPDLAPGVCDRTAKKKFESHLKSLNFINVKVWEVGLVCIAKITAPPIIAKF